MKRLFILSLTFLSGCATTQYVELNSHIIDQHGVSFPIEKPSRLKYRVLEFCIEPNEKYGRDISFDNTGSAYIDGDKRIEVFVQFSGEKKSMKMEFPKLYLNRNLACISIRKNILEKYKFIEVSSSLPMVIDKVYWYRYFY